MRRMRKVISFRMRTRTRTRARAPGFAIHLSIVRHYLSGIFHRFDFKQLPPSVRLFRNAINMPVSYINIVQVAATFSQEIREVVFMVWPRPNEYQVIGKYKPVEVFVSFLLQLLRNTPDSLFDPFKDQIDDLEKELRFIRTLVGDASLQQQPRHFVQGSNDPLEEFEAVANEAGSVVHSLFFFTSQRMDEGLALLFNHINLLKDNIMKYLDRPPLIISTNLPRTSVLDSLLIVDSLLGDLIKGREDNPISDHVKEQFRMLHQVLLNLHPSEIDGEVGTEHVMRIGDKACEAEYLIVSFLAGDAPPSYLVVRLTRIIPEIERIWNELQAIKKTFEGARASKEAAMHLSLGRFLPPKRNSTLDVVTVGLEGKEIHILEHLLGRSRHLQIIFITGMPGLGKTTFAQKLHNHPSLSYQFDKCSFCVISQSYEKKSVLLDIINDQTNKVLNSMDEENLVIYLYKSLKGRRYFIVMDDMWDSNVWDDLKRCFPDDGNGSRILITSRERKVAPLNAIIYELPSLTDDECWDLLEKKVFQSDPCPRELVEIGKKIAANCRGVPLAVVSVAGILLSMDKEVSEWVKVGQNLASFLFEGGDDTVMRILELSYKHLPIYLKRCFLYLGVFSKRKVIVAQELLRLWIAEGFVITHNEQRKSAESVAEEYLMELIDKNLAIVSRRRSDGGVRACIVHDLLWDLCLRKCEEEKFLKIADRNNVTTTLSKYPRLVADRRLSPFDYRQDLRSLRCSRDISSVYASNMKLLRVLSFHRRGFLRGKRIHGLDFLVCLRYLCTKELPACIGSLVNLEFLVVEAWLSVVIIPSVVLKMMKLRYVELLYDATYGGDCNSSETNNLEFMSTIRIYNLRDVEMLRSSPRLRKLRCHFKALWDEETEVYRHPDLGFLTRLESLNMRRFGEAGMGEIRFPVNIKKLTLESVICAPNWENIMEAVRRLPKLEVLKLVDVGEFDQTWETKDGEFEQLKFLKLDRVAFGRWNVHSSQCFPRLEQLFLINCSQLQKIPSEIGEIATLRLIEVHSWCTKSLVDSAKQMQQEQHELGNEELRVIFSEVRHRDSEQQTPVHVSDEEN